MIKIAFPLNKKYEKMNKEELVNEFGIDNLIEIVNLKDKKFVKINTEHNKVVSILNKYSTNEEAVT